MVKNETVTTNIKALINHHTVGVFQKDMTAIMRIMNKHKMTLIYEFAIVLMKLCVENYHQCKTVN